MLTPLPENTPCGFCLTGVFERYDDCLQSVLPVLTLCLSIARAVTGVAAPPVEVDFSRSFSVELPATSPVGEASLREHTIVWHPVKQKYYLVADVVPLDSPHHPNTYETELHLWSSGDLTDWVYHGVAVEKGTPGLSDDGYGVASPAGMVFFRDRLLVPFSARRTERFQQRSIGMAVSGSNPEKIPWKKTGRPISDLSGEDDDPAFLVQPGGNRVHLYHRRTGPGGYRIVHTASASPEDPDTWPPAQPVTPRPQEVRAQELTGAFVANGKVHLLVIEHLVAGGIRIAHLRSDSPDGPFEPADPGQRSLPPGAQPRSVAYAGHITPAIRSGTPVAFFWTVPQQGRRYGLQGHPLRPPDR